MALHHLNIEGGADDDDAAQMTEFKQESVGKLLRRTREKHGQSLRAIADALCIRPAYLEAIEAGRYEELPGAPYAMGFLRSYAEFLSLDAEHVLLRFKEETAAPKVQQDLVIPEPMAEVRRPLVPLVMVSLIFLALAFGGWVYLSGQNSPSDGVTPSVSERLQNMFQDVDDAERTLSAAPTGQEEIDASSAAGKLENELSGVGAQREEVVEDQLAVTPDGEAAPEGAATQPEGDGAAPASEPVENDSDASLSPENGPQVAQGGATEASADEPAAGSDAIQDDNAAEAGNSGAPVQSEPQDESAENAGSAALVGETPTETAAGPARNDDAASGGAASPRAADPLVQNASVSANVSGGETGGQTGNEGAQGVQTAELPTIPGEDAESGYEPAYQREPVVYGEISEDTRIVLKAQQDSWVQVRDAEENLLLTRVLRSGDSYHVPNQDGLTLLTGNAGGLQIQVDGAALPKIGPIGVVRRDIPLEPTKLLDGSAYRR